MGERALNKGDIYQRLIVKRGGLGMHSPKHPPIEVWGIKGERLGMLGGVLMGGSLEELVEAWLVLGIAWGKAHFYRPPVSKAPHPTIPYKGP